MYNVSNKLNNQTEYYTTKVGGSRAEFGPNVSHYSASLCPESIQLNFPKICGVNLSF